MNASFPPSDNAVTRLLLSWKEGDEGAVEELVPLLYDELRLLASRAMAREAGGHTLQTTALVNEAYVRLVGAHANWEGRRHFLRVAARAMRQVLVDHARKKNSQKRGENPVQLEVHGLEGVLPAAPEADFAAEVLDLDEALARLFALDERKGRAVELHYFGGLSYEEVAGALEISPATVHRDLRMARAWLHKELSDGE